jgi:hypothetical protein
MYMHTLYTKVIKYFLCSTTVFTSWTTIFINIHFSWPTEFLISTAAALSLCTVIVQRSSIYNICKDKTHCDSYEQRIILYPASFCYVWLYVQMNLLGIISVDFEVTGQLQNT